MALNAYNAEKPNVTVNKQEPLEAGNYLARVVQVIDLGLQAQRPYKGQDKPPAHEIMITYELVTEFCTDENGEVMEDKPRFISETFPLRHISSDLATSTKRIKCLDPKDKLKGDFSQLIGAPCTVTVVQNAGKGEHVGKVFVNIGAVTPPMKGIPIPELLNEPKVFDLDEPNMEIFESLPEWLQDKIKKNLNFKGSVLEKELTGISSSASETNETSEDSSDEDYDDDVPY